jgi:CBS domain-containing protein
MEELYMLTVKDLLLRKGRKKIVSIDPDATVYEALHTMKENNVGALLIIENEELRGIFSERDYARKIALTGKSGRDTFVKDVMVTKLISVTPENGVEHCMNLMTEQRVRHLPVFENKKLVGIISIGDVVKGVIDEQKTTINDLEKYISGGFLSRDSLQ